MDIFDIIETTYKTYVQVRRIIFLTQLFLFVSTVTTIWVAAWLLFGINLFSPVFRLVRWICEKFTRFILPKKMCIEIKGKNALITG